MRKINQENNNNHAKNFFFKHVLNLNLEFKLS